MTVVGWLSYSDVFTHSELWTGTAAHMALAIHTEAFC